ncbi:MAG: DUF559 domain-containing protein [Rudaea sp.]|uniref:endonuclease domain-containing protein n=1 Tax=unclassified Rudaea TaxID=2627037 RepID=UPI0010F4F468|nr:MULTISPECIES: DUF559 domain-containing protein [unclassified Rudaea]MBN8886960.1 DUF559 domain-containing protein [Rudaea sp.]MBR0345926.1 DUF559 domain-containing protein [Rudaea sp.]
MELRRDIDKARGLRERSTDCERELWRHLRHRRLDGYKFRRQFPIVGYVVDFVCLEKKLIVELDGSQHAEQKVYDGRRTEILKKNGYRVTRFWNNALLERRDDVPGRILECLEEVVAPPSPQPLSRRRERG